MSSKRCIVLIDCHRVTKVTRGFPANYFWEGGFPPFTGVWGGH